MSVAGLFSSKCVVYFLDSPLLLVVGLSFPQMSFSGHCTSELRVHQTAVAVPAHVRKPPRKMGRDYSQVHGMIGQEGMSSN